MPKKSVAIGELFFSAKGEAKDYFAQILNKHALGEELSGDEFDNVMALLLCHPRAEEKIGSGVKSIKIDRGFDSSNRCFHIVRDDNSIENFSIDKCISGDRSSLHKFCIACRKVVEADLRSEKIDYFERNSDKEGRVVCPITKEKIAFEEAHIDHREPLTFSAIVHFFIKAKNIDIDVVSYATEGRYGNEFKCTELANDFKYWHHDNAKLRVVKAKANLSKSYLGRVKPTKADTTLK